MHERLSKLVGALRTDLGSSVGLPRIAVYDSRKARWIFDTKPADQPPQTDGFDSDVVWIACVAGDTFAVEGSSLPELAVELVSHLQDVIIDSTGLAWPEIYVDDLFVGLAVPGLDGRGQPGWHLVASRAIPFGKLPTSARLS